MSLQCSSTMLPREEAEPKREGVAGQGRQGTREVREQAREVGVDE